MTPMDAGWAASMMLTPRASKHNTGRSPPMQNGTASALVAGASPKMHAVLASASALARGASHGASAAGIALMGSTARMGTASAREVR